MQQQVFVNTQAIQKIRALCMMLRVPLLAVLITAGLSASPIIQYQVTSLGTNGSGQALYQYHYFLSGIDLLTNQEIDIQFDPSVFGQLSNGVAGPGFDLLLFQPNQPAGEHGDYSALATVDHPATDGTFSVNFTLSAGVTTPPASQLFFLFDDTTSPSGVIFSGTTTLFTTTPSGVPEPWSVALCGSGLMAVCVSRFLWRRRAHAA
jgi:hypothetical protein